jgi:pimeloyl-ACP methyl ester carboxylesterase
MVEELLRRYDPDVFHPGDREARVRLGGAASDGGDVDVLLDGDGPRAGRPSGRPDALIRADPGTWSELASSGAAMDAFRRGRLHVRRDLHLGVGFLAATSGAGLRFTTVATEAGPISTMEAGSGPPVLLLHGLGASKVSFLPTVGALAATHRVIAVDLPGFGDSVKPLRAPYDAAYFARAIVALLDALGIDRADIVGNSMGGRVALEVGMAHADRARRLVLLAPSLAWLRSRPFAPLLKLVPPQLGAIQPAPRALVEAVVGRAIQAENPWMAAGVDEFLRSYLTTGGRVAFYAAARNIYLENPHGQGGFWPRLQRLQVPSLFVWGERDTLVPIRFAEHVRRVLPDAEHLELSCGHVPQMERPRDTHAAMRRFLR